MSTSEDSRRRAGLVLGPLIFVVLLALPAPEGLSPNGWRTAAVGLLMATFWVTEAIPIAATALIPIVFFPGLGVLSTGEATAPYANPVIYLFMGGFMMAAALQSCGLHRRIALTIIHAVGTSPSRLIGGFMMATAFISMWVSNTATVVMMLPMAMSVIEMFEKDNQEERSATFSVALLLGIAYAANIGGLGTLIGTPPNALLAGYFLETWDLRIGFGQWMLLGVPLVIVALPMTWLFLVRLFHQPVEETRSDGAEVIEREKKALGEISGAEWTVGGITLGIAILWITRPMLASIVPGLDDTVIAIGGALVLFLVPAGWRPLRRLLDWKLAEQLPWSVLVLFGGGLSLASAIQKTGLADWIGHFTSGFLNFPLPVMVLILTTVVILLTEITSNTATAAAFIPVAASVAVGMGHDPLLLAIPTALAASCAFMLPVATPPNAIVFGSGRIGMAQMIRAGIWLNVAMVILIQFAVFGLAVRIFVTSP